jgi:hypothetical protein
MTTGDDLAADGGGWASLSDLERGRKRRKRRKGRKKGAGRAPARLEFIAPRIYCAFGAVSGARNAESSPFSSFSVLPIVPFASAAFVSI